MKYLGLDIDGIVADTDKTLRNYLHKLYGYNLKQSDITSFYYEECSWFEKGKMDDFWKRFNEDDGWLKIDLVDDVQDALNTLSGKFAFVLISSRPAFLQDVTEKWLIEKKIPFNNLIVTEQKSKSEIITDNKFDVQYFVEDRHDFALDIAESNINVFLYDYPWNQDDTLHKNIKRVYSWE
ncbi:hypothetical protein ACFL4A_00005, partial [bacterium]